MLSTPFILHEQASEFKVSKRAWEPIILDVNLTYRDRASIRIQNLEILLMEKLSNLEEYLNLINLDKDSFTSEEIIQINLVRRAFVKYLNWAKMKIQIFQDMLNRMNGKRDKPREQEKKLQLKFLKKLSVEADQQSYYLINITRRIYNDNQMQFYPQGNHIISTKYVGPIEFNGFLVSDIISNGIDLYCSTLDPDAFWLDRTFLTEIIGRPEKSLLKSLLFDTFFKHIAISKYGASYQYLNDSSSLETLLPHCYSNPSRESLVALMLLCLEEGWKFNSDKKKMYLGKAFRMAEIMNLDPDQQENLDTTETNSIEPWKSQIWQTLFYIHNVIFTTVPWPPLFRTKTKMSFEHLYKSTYCIPTSIRSLKTIAETEIQLINDSKPEFIPSIKIKQANQVALDESKNYYKEVLKKGMLQCQILINLHTVSCANSQGSEGVYIDINTKQFKEIESDINSLVDKTPKKILIPTVVPEFYLCNQMVHKSFAFEQPYMSAMSYNGLLTIKISLYYPLALINPKPQRFASLYACTQALDAADRLYVFFVSFLNKYLTADRPSTIQLVTLADMLPAIFTYLNCIIQETVASWQYRRYLGKAQTLIDGLETILYSDRSTVDAKSTHNDLVEALSSFNLPNPYKIFLRSSENCKN